MENPSINLPHHYCKRIITSVSNPSRREAHRRLAIQNKHATLVERFDIRHSRECERTFFAEPLELGIQSKYPIKWDIVYGTKVPVPKGNRSFEVPLP
jgi:hypothetical protein